MFRNLDLSSDNAFAVIVASSVDAEPIASSKRLLVTVIGRVEPTGFRLGRSIQREVADPGRPPLLQEPVFARVVMAAQGDDQGLRA